MMRQGNINLSSAFQTQSAWFRNRRAVHLSVSFSAIGSPNSLLIRKCLNFLLAGARSLHHFPLIIVGTFDWNTLPQNRQENPSQLFNLP